MRNGLPYVQVNVVESEKKASQPGTPQKTEIHGARFEPTVQEINEGYERELKSNAESHGLITTEGYEQDLQGDAESYEDYEQERKGDAESYESGGRDALRSNGAPLLSNAGGPLTAPWSAARGQAVCHQRVGQSECVEEVHPLPSQQHGLRAVLGLEKAGAEMPPAAGPATF